MFQSTTRKGATAVLAALCLGLATGSVALQLGCGGKSKDTDIRAPYISKFVASLSSAFPTTPATATGTTLYIASGQNPWFKANFSTTDGQGVLTSNNGMTPRVLQSNLAFQLGAITQDTDYTLTVNNSKGVKVTSVVAIRLQGAPSPTYTAPTSVVVDSTGNQASITNTVATWRYAWSVTSSNATLTGATNTATASFTAPTTLVDVGLRCAVTNESNQTANVDITVPTVDTTPTGLTYTNESPTYTISVPVATNTPTLTGLKFPALATYSVSPSLPSGLVLNANGTITGTPDLSNTPFAATPFTVTARAGSSSASVQGASTPRVISMTLEAAPAASLTSDVTTVGPNGTAVLTWSVGGPVTSITVTGGSLNQTIDTTSVKTGTVTVNPATTTTYTLTPNVGTPVTCQVIVDSTPVTIGSFTAAVAPYYATGTSLDWTISAGLPVTQWVEYPTGNKVSGDLVGTARTYALTGLLPRRSTATLKSGFGATFASADAAVIVRGLDFVAGNKGSRGCLDGGVDADGYSLARFYQPNSIATDGTNVFIADTQNHVIRKIDASRNVTTIAGIAGNANTDLPNLNTPRGVGVDTATGIVYVGGETQATRRIVSLTPNGDTYTANVVTLTGAVPAAGPNANAFAIEGGIMYFADYTDKGVYKVTLSTGASEKLVDLSTGAVVLNAPTGIAKSGNNLFIASSGNHTIVRVDLTTNTGSVYAGTAGTAGFTDSTTNRLAALLRNPYGVAADANGNVYVIERNNYALRVLPAAGDFAGGCITLAGVTGTFTQGFANTTYTMSGTGSNAAALCSPYAITLASSVGGNAAVAYIADSSFNAFEGNCVRKVTFSGAPTTGMVTTLDNGDTTGKVYAGTPRVNGLVNGTGAAAQFGFIAQNSGATSYSGANVAVNPVNGTTYIADTQNSRVRIVTPAGVVTTLQIASADVVVSLPKSVAVQLNPAGDSMVALFVGETAGTGVARKLRKFTTADNGATFTEDAAFTVSGGTYPTNLLVNHQGLAVDSVNGFIYASDATAGKVFKINAATGASTDFIAATGSTPVGLALQGGATPYLWVAVQGGNVVNRYELNTPANVTPYGNATAGFTDGDAATVRFAKPNGVAVDSLGNVYITEYTNHSVRMINAAGITSTLVGMPIFTGVRVGNLVPDSGADTTKVLSAGLYQPQGLAINAQGDLVIGSCNSVLLLTAPANQ